MESNELIQMLRKSRVPEEYLQMEAYSTYVTALADKYGSSWTGWCPTGSDSVVVAPVIPPVVQPITYVTWPTIKFSNGTNSITFTETSGSVTGDKFLTHNTTLDLTKNWMITSTTPDTSIVPGLYGSVGISINNPQATTSTAGMFALVIRHGYVLSTIACINNGVSTALATLGTNTVPAYVIGLKEEDSKFYYRVNTGLWIEVIPPAGFLTAASTRTATRLISFFTLTNGNTGTFNLNLANNL